MPRSALPSPASRRARPGPAARARRRAVLAVVLGVLAALAAAGPAAAHTGLAGSSPAAADTVGPDVADVRIRFTDRVHARLTTLVLERDGAPVETDTLGPGEPQGRAFVLPLPDGLAPGTYTATWRTVAADGHPIGGTFAFVVLDPAAPEPPPGPAAEPGAAPPPPPPPSPPPGPAGPGLLDPLPVVLRWAGFLSLLGMIGAVGFRFGVLGRLGRLEEVPGLAAVALRAAYGAWWVALAAAALGVLTLPTRLWVQSAILGGAAGALDPERLRLLVAGTPWGMAWLLQALATLAYLVGLAVERAPHGRTVGWAGAGVGALLLSTVPALSGHTITVDRLVGVAIVADVLHVLGAGLWLGTLGVLLAVGLPATADAVPAPRGPTVAALLRAFSPLALVSAAVVALSGVVAAAFHLTAVPDLWTTPYGRTLLIKLALVGIVGLLGLYNWRRVLPGLGGEGSGRAIHETARVEVAVAALVLLVTAVLVATPPP
jgi:putative copper export protein